MRRQVLLIGGLSLVLVGVFGAGYTLRDLARGIYPPLLADKGLAVALQPQVHIPGAPLVIAAARRLGGTDFVLACTDAGRAKWVESLANDLNVAAAFVYKRRHDDATEVTGVSAQVAGKRVVIYDDMIRTGGSLVSAARAYRDAGAVAIDAIATHGVFPADSLARIADSGLLGRIVVTDSHPRAVALQNGFLEVDSTATLLAEHLISNR